MAALAHIYSIPIYNIYRIKLICTGISKCLLYFNIFHLRSESNWIDLPFYCLISIHIYASSEGSASTEKRGINMVIQSDWGKCQRNCNYIIFILGTWAYFEWAHGNGSRTNQKYHSVECFVLMSIVSVAPCFCLQIRRELNSKCSCVCSLTLPRLYHLYEQWASLYWYGQSRLFFTTTYSHILYYESLLDSIL